MWSVGLEVSRQGLGVGALGVSPFSSSAPQRRSGTTQPFSSLLTLPLPLPVSVHPGVHFPRPRPSMMEEPRATGVRSGPSRPSRRCLVSPCRNIVRTPTPLSVGRESTCPLTLICLTWVSVREGVVRRRSCVWKWFHDGQRGAAVPGYRGKKVPPQRPVL